MNRALYIATLLTILACGPRVAGQSFSSVTKYNNCTGDKTLIRKNQTSYTVTCYHDEHNCSSFIVESQIRRKFATTSYSNNGQTPLAPQTGYIVRDMELLDGVCWFCGEKWVETGQMLYTLEGLAYPEVLHYGFIGRFNMADVIAGNGNYETMVISGTEVLTALAVYVSGVTAIGGAIDHPYSSCVVELQETSFPGSYLVTTEVSSNSEEVFMDVTCAGGKVITLSRFNNPANSSYYNYRFGLRYGTPSSFTYTANTLYCYNTSLLFSIPDAGKFYNLSPIFLCKTNNGKGVVVSHLGEGSANTNIYSGHLMLYHIGSEGATSVEVKNNYDMDVYSEIKEITFNVPFNTYSKMAILLDGNTLRFPLWASNYNYDTVMYTNDYNLASMVYYYAQSGLFDISGVGYDSTNKIVRLYQNVNSDWPTWNSMTCMQTKWGQFSGNLKNNCLETINQNMNIITAKGVTFSSFPFTSSWVTTQQTCVDGN